MKNEERTSTGEHAESPRTRGDLAETQLNSGEQRARKIMVRLDSGYVLLSPAQWAKLCSTS